MERECIISCIQDNIDIHNALLNNQQLHKKISILVDKIVSAINNGGKIVTCGNGGSASDALHFTGEIVGRFQKERVAFPAVCLNAEVATMTAIANDYGFEFIFSRQVEGLVNSGDIFIGISTSGNSKNIYSAMEMARQKGAFSVALTGRDGGALAGMADISIVIPADNTARIQECHILIIHIICEMVEEKLT